jgi:hypothetical protein
MSSFDRANFYTAVPFPLGSDFQNQKGGTPISMPGMGPNFCTFRTFSEREPMTPAFTPEQATIIEIEEAAGRMAWLRLVLKEAKGEQYLRPRKYRISAKDFVGNIHVQGLMRTAGWKE